MSSKDIKITKKVSIISMVANLVLLCLKLLVSLISKSQAMLADTLNSGGDIVNSLVSYIGAKISSKPEDEDHPHGHGKADYIFAGIISLCMIIAALDMIYNSVLSIINNQAVVFSYKLIIVCLITILTKIMLFLYTRVVLKKNDNILIRANNEDHRNDIFLTTGTIIGIIFSLLGIHFVDGVVGIIISCSIIYSASKLLSRSYIVLMDTSLNADKENEIKEFVEKNEAILHVDSLISKPIGESYIIILKISMDGNVSLKHAHDLSGKIKSEIKEQFDFVSDVIIHVNPH